jgi:hypothetical protein
VRIVTESDLELGDVEVVQLELSVALQNAALDEKQREWFEQTRVSRGEDADIEEAIISAGIAVEWKCVSELHGFVGKADALFARLRDHIDGHAPLANWTLFLGTAHRAQNALMGLHVTHEAQKPLHRLTCGLDKIYELECAHQHELSIRNQLKGLQ